MVEKVSTQYGLESVKGHAPDGSTPEVPLLPLLKPELLLEPELLDDEPVEVDVEIDEPPVVPLPDELAELEPEPEPDAATLDAPELEEDDEPTLEALELDDEDDDVELELVTLEPELVELADAPDDELAELAPTRAGQRAGSSVPETQ